MQHNTNFRLRQCFVLMSELLVLVDAFLFLKLILSHSFLIGSSPFELWKRYDVSVSQTNALDTQYRRYSAENQTGFQEINTYE